MCWDKIPIFSNNNDWVKHWLQDLWSYTPHWILCVDQDYSIDAASQLICPLFVTGGTLGAGTGIDSISLSPRAQQSPQRTVGILQYLGSNWVNKQRNAVVYPWKLTVVTWGEITPFVCRVFWIKHSAATTLKQPTTAFVISLAHLDFWHFAKQMDFWSLTTSKYIHIKTQASWVPTLGLSPVCIQHEGHQLIFATSEDSWKAHKSHGNPNSLTLFFYPFKNIFFHCF